MTTIDSSRSISWAQEAVRLLPPIIVIGLGLLGFVILSSLKKPSVRETPPSVAPLVETAVAAVPDRGLEIKVDGLVVPFREIELAGEVTGQIVFKSEVCRAGRYLTRGTPLFEIDRRDYELEVRRLDKDLIQAGVSLQEIEVEISNTESLIQLAQEELTLQQRELQRLLSLAGNRVVSETEVDRARRSELSARNSLLTLRNQLHLLGTRRNRIEQARELVQAQKEKAELDLSRTQVSAPLDGVVVKDWVEQGSFIQKGTKLVAIEDTSAVEVKCNLRMDELYWLWRQPLPVGELAAGDPAQRDYQLPQAPATVLYRMGGREYSWNGVLTRFDGIGLDEKTRTVPCRVLVPRPREVKLASQVQSPSPVPGRSDGPPALMRGMYVEVHIHAQPEASLTAVPEQALRPGNVLWLVRDGKLSVRKVEVAGIVDEQAFLQSRASGISPGDRVVISPLATVSDGMAVREAAAP